jgi:hypothetical protein
MVLHAMREARMNSTDDLRTRLARLRGVIEGLRETCDAATPGPWKSRKENHKITGHAYGWIAGTSLDLSWLGTSNAFEKEAEFIAESRTWLPRLLSLARARLQEAEALDPAHDCGAIVERLSEMERCLLPEEGK